MRMRVAFLALLAALCASPVAAQITGGGGSGAAICGAPVAGNLAKWSTSNCLTNTDLTGAVTTSGSGVTTLATQAADTLLMNASGGTASPTAVAPGSCSTASSALTYNTSTHAFGCNSISGGASVCTTIALSVQYDNAGVLGCAPLVYNSGVMNFTGTQFQFGGSPAFTVANNPAFFNVAFGGSTMPAVTGGGAFNICGGYGDSGNAACMSLTNAQQNVILGFDAGQQVTSGGTNTFLGYQAGMNQTTGSNNVAIGSSACKGASAVQFSGDICIGNQAGTAINANVSNDIFIGISAGKVISSGSGNTFLGANAGLGVTTGGVNICFGFGSCNGLITGSNDIVLSNQGVIGTCVVSSSSVNNEFDLCSNGGGGGDAIPTMRCNLVSIAAGNCKFNVPDASPGFVVSTLPAAPPTGSRAYVTDAVACTFLASLTGGGSTFCPVEYNGSAWIAS